MFSYINLKENSKKGGEKERKTTFFLFYKRKDLTFSFEIPYSPGKSNDGFRTIFVFKIRQQTKKSIPIWHICCLKNGCVYVQTQQG